MEWELSRNCDSYDELEEQLARKPTGTIGWLLPEALYRFCFGVRPPASEDLEARRESVRVTYERSIDRFEGLCEELASGLEGNPSRTPSDEVLAGGISPPNVTEWLPPPRADHGGVDLKAYQRELDREATRLVWLRQSTTALLEAPNRAFLTESEQQRLEAVLEVLETALTALRSWQETVVATTELSGCLPDWEQRITDLQARMEPYRSYEVEEIDGDIQAQIDTLLEELDDIEQRADVSLLAVADRATFQRYQTRLEDFLGHLDDYRSAFIKSRFEQTYASVEGTVEAVQKRLHPARNQGDSITDAAKLRQQLSAAREELQSLRSYPLSEHLAGEKLETIEAMDHLLDDIEGYVDAKTTFDDAFEDVEATVESLEEAANPYLAYERYLTEPKQLQLEDRISAASNAVSSLRERVHPNRVTAPDQERLGAAIETIDSVEDCLEGYNERYVELERERHAELFTDIGPQNLDLSPAQQRAVIRNGVYNQVIAAAGTGKTLVLVTRVAYLLRTQDVDPERMLVLAFTNEAKDEVTDRLESYFGITDVEVKTIHAFGRQLLASAGEPVDNFDSHQRANFIEDVIRDARQGNNDEFLSHYYDFLVHYDDVYLDEADFEDKEAYVERRREQQYRTLKGESVKSRAEKRIADYLFTHNVEYRYEKFASWADTADDRGVYEPDFYLPDYDIYIEHWGLDTAGEVAPWFTRDTAAYHEDMRWKRTQFESNEASLVETYNFEFEAGRLEAALEHRLSVHGVELDRMDFEELVETAFDYEQREGYIKKKFGKFIENAKEFELKPNDIEAALDSDHPRQYHFAKCGIILLQQYQRLLVEEELIDFEDMLNDAVRLLEANATWYRNQYDHVFVDEFQDVGERMVEMLQVLTGWNGARLFVVGDDWQSIYSFRGSKLTYFVNFEEHFGRATRTTLTENFRSPPTVIEAGNQLIEHNDEQLPKRVEPTVTQETTPLVHPLDGYNRSEYAEFISHHVLYLVQHYLENGSSPGDVMVVCRYDDAVAYLHRIRDRFDEHGIPHASESTQGDAVSVYTLYKAKGREAKHVILVHAAEGRFGFPDDERTNDLLEPVLPIETNTIAEERRAFYVALTRTQSTLDLLTRRGQVSRFLTEIDDYTIEREFQDAVQPLGDIGSNTSVVARVRHLNETSVAGMHQSGFLVDKYGGSAGYVAWNSTNPPTLEEDRWYRFSDLAVDEYEGEKRLKWTLDSQVTPLEGQDSFTSPSSSIS